MHITKPEEVHIVRLVRFGAERVPEKQQQVDFVAGNSGCNLLVTALRATQKALNLKSGSF